MPAGCGRVPLHLFTTFKDPFIRHIKPPVDHFDALIFRCKVGSSSHHNPSLSYFVLSFYSSPTVLVLFGGCVAECRLGSRHSTPSSSNYSLNNSFTNCLRNLNKKYSIHTKKKLICWCMKLSMHTRKLRHWTKKKRQPRLPFDSGSGSYLNQSTPKTASNSPVMKLTSAQPLSQFSSQTDRSQQEMERVYVCWMGWMFH